MTSTFVVHVEIPDDGPLQRAELEWLLVKAAAQISQGGVCAPLKDRHGKRIGYWAFSPEQLKIDFFNKHRSS
jgi:hypothetical protein